MTAQASASEIPEQDMHVRAEPEPVGEGLPSITRLKNGLTVLTQRDDRFPLVSLRLYVHAGSAYEIDKQAGISHLLEHMVFKGTAKRGPGQVASDVESAGGYLNAATSFDYTVYYVDLPAEKWRLGLDVLQDMIFGARIDPADLESEKQVVLSELERGEDEPRQLQFKALQDMVWNATNYGRPIIGFRETVSSISRQDMLDYIHRMYQPQSMLLVAVGDVSQSEVLAEARRLFGGLANDRELHPAMPFPVPENAGGPRVRVLTGKWNKAYVSLAFPIPPLASEEEPGLEALAQMLGGDKTSRLYRRFKYELGMVDEIGASALTLERGGMFVVQASMDADKVEPFVKGLAAELKSLSGTSFADEELARARLNIEDSLFTSKETLSGLASKLGYFQFFEHSTEAERNYLLNLRNVDRSRVDRLIRAYAASGNVSVCVLAPEGQAPEAESLTTAITDAWPAAPRETLAEAPEGKRGQAEVVKVGRSTVVFEPDRTLPYTALSIFWPGGDALLTPEEQGLAMLTARSLTRGAGDKNATAVEDFLADRAADLAAQAQRDSFSLAAKFPTRFSDDILGLVESVLTRPRFAEAEVDRARMEQVATIRRSEDQPTGLAFRRMFPFLFQGTGYGYYHAGMPDELARFDATAVAGFWERQKARPFVLGVCGDFDRDKVLALAERLDKLLNGHGSGEQAFTFPDPAWSDAQALNLTLPERNQAHLLSVYPVPGLDSPDAAGVALLRDILAGQSGILFRKLRDEQGLGYSVTAMVWQAPRTGFMAFYIGTTPDKLEQARQGFEAVAAELAAKPLPPEELARGASTMRGDYYRDNQALLSRASEAASLIARGEGIDYNRELIEKAERMTPEELRELAAKLFAPGKAYEVTVTP